MKGIPTQMCCIEPPVAVQDDFGQGKLQKRCSEGLQPRCLTVHSSALQLVVESHGGLPNVTTSTYRRRSTPQGKNCPRTFDCDSCKESELSQIPIICCAVPASGYFLARGFEGRAEKTPSTKPSGQVPKQQFVRAEFASGL